MNKSWGSYASVENGCGWTPDWLAMKITEVDARISIFNNVTAYPSKMDKVNRNVFFNLFSEEHNPLIECNYLRGRDLKVFTYITDYDHSDDIELVKIERPVVYLGWLNPHYGHFLMESLSRLWALKYLEKNLLSECFFYFDIHTSRKEIDSKAWIFNMLDAFGVSKSNIIWGDGNYNFSKFIVPSQSMRLHNSVNVETQRYIWKRLSFYLSKNDTPSSGYHKIYLSRSKLLKDKRRLANEVALEGELEKIGFKILYPEQIPLEEQVVIYRNAKLLVGPSGSALHNAAFMASGARVISLTTKDFCLLNELLCCYVNEVGYSIFLCDGESKAGWSVHIDSFIKYLGGLDF